MCAGLTVHTESTIAAGEAKLKIFEELLRILHVSKMDIVSTMIHTETELYDKAIKHQLEREIAEHMENLDNSDLNPTSDESDSEQDSVLPRIIHGSLRPLCSLTQLETDHSDSNNTAFQNVRVKLAAALAKQLNVARVTLRASDTSLKAYFPSVVDWTINCNILHASPDFHRKPRHDYALVKVHADQCIFVQILYMLHVTYKDIDYHMALVLPFDVPRAAINRRRDNELRFTRNPTDNIGRSNVSALRGSSASAVSSASSRLFDNRLSSRVVPSDVLDRNNALENNAHSSESISASSSFQIPTLLLESPRKLYDLYMSSEEKVSLLQAEITKLKTQLAESELRFIGASSTARSRALKLASDKLGTQNPSQLDAATILKLVKKLGWNFQIFYLPFLDVKDFSMPHPNFGAYNLERHSVLGNSALGVMADLLECIPPRYHDLLLSPQSDLYSEKYVNAFRTAGMVSNYFLNPCLFRIACMALFGKTSVNSVGRAVSHSVSQYMRTNIPAEMTFGLISWACMVDQQFENSGIGGQTQIPYKADFQYYKHQLVELYHSPDSSTWVQYLLATLDRELFDNHNKQKGHSLDDQNAETIDIDTIEEDDHDRSEIAGDKEQLRLWSEAQQNSTADADNSDAVPGPHLRDPPPIPRVNNEIDYSDRDDDDDSDIYGDKAPPFRAFTTVPSSSRSSDSESDEAPIASMQPSIIIHPSESMPPDPSKNNTNPTRQVTTTNLNRQAMTPSMPKSDGHSPLSDFEGSSSDHQIQPAISARAVQALAESTPPLNAKKKAPAKKPAPVTVPRTTCRKAAADASTPTDMGPDLDLINTVTSRSQLTEIISKELAAKPKRGRPAASKKVTKG
ncbi:hypothetical protein HYPSUDRAFT_56508 [Hypholoma sublateritium FD-334 SS-4]|uniref:Uncharacterized protein n=1 Tax=Hypholoma sublateritium (strain FD-334 SS-4) TaxID=945553 RepID=A0A0D2NST0_HYPSF|nr:hypothetical protein HYPSUDRAFT_56508 [Hypholoma sublateritium FD-334 SS-4]